VGGRIARQSQRPQSRGLFQYRKPVGLVLDHGLLAVSQPLLFLLESCFGTFFVLILSIIPHRQRRYSWRYNTAHRTRDLCRLGGYLTNAATPGFVPYPNACV
jgi:hypothetical protein